MTLGLSSSTPSSPVQSGNAEYSMDTTWFYKHLQNQEKYLLYEEANWNTRKCPRIQQHIQQLQTVVGCQSVTAAEFSLGVSWGKVSVCDWQKRAMNPSSEQLQMVLTGPTAISLMGTFWRVFVPLEKFHTGRKSQVGKSLPSITLGLQELPQGVCILYDGSRPRSEPLTLKCWLSYREYRKWEPKLNSVKLKNGAVSIFFSFF